MRTGYFVSISGAHFGGADEPLRDAGKKMDDVDRHRVEVGDEEENKQQHSSLRRWGSGSGTLRVESGGVASGRGRRGAARLVHTT